MAMDINRSVYDLHTHIMYIVQVKVSWLRSRSTYVEYNDNLTFYKVLVWVIFLQVILACRH